MKKVIWLFLVMTALAGCQNFGNSNVVYVEDNKIQRAIQVMAGESLTSVGFRLKEANKYTRVVFDLQSRNNLSARRNTEIKIGSEVDLASIFGVDSLKTLEISDEGGHALIITDYGYEAWESPQIFDVREGDLTTNAIRLAAFLGWSLIEGDWTANNYPIPSHPLVVPNDPQRAMGKLLHEYPAAAQLNPNNRTIKVMPRLDAIN